MVYELMILTQREGGRTTHIKRHMLVKICYRKLKKRQIKKED